MAARLPNKHTIATIRIILRPLYNRLSRSAMPTKVTHIRILIFVYTDRIRRCRDVAAPRGWWLNNDREANSNG